MVVVNEEEEEDEWEIEEDMGLGRNEREEDIFVPLRFFSSEGLSNHLSFSGPRLCIL